MGALEVFAGTTSVLTRITAFAFLRIIPGHIGTYCRWLFLASAVGLYLINRKLRFIEEETSRTMHAEQARYIENGNGSEQQTSPSSPYGKSSKKQHKKNKPSYAEIAAKGAAAAKDTAVVQEHQGGGAGTGTGADAGQAATRRPPTSHLARDVGVPSRPGYLHLLFGLPSSSRRGNWLAIVINAGLLAMALDFQYTPLLGKNVHDTTFIRVGAVADTSVKLVARLPPSLFAPTAAPAHFHAARRAAALDSAGHAGDRHALSHETPDAVNIVYRPVKPHGAWLFGGSVAAGAETDYVGVLKLESLLPGTEYEYAMVLPDAQAHRHVAPSVAHPHYFRTAPDPRLSVRQTHFTFAASSCIKPNWPYVPGRDHLSIRGAAELAEHIVPKSIDFALLLGDFIYADVPSRIANAAAYAKKYRQNYASRDWRRVYEAIPVLGIWDDHEIVNDYAGQGNDSQPYFEMANSAYSAYVGSANPDPIVPGAHYYTFDHGDVSFFVMDTRRYRSANEATDDEQKTMLGDEQKMYFVQWLADKNQTATWKFVVSSVPFLTNWAGPNGQFDTWGGFQTERTELMDIMEYVPNIIFISGDRHEFAAAIIREKVLDFSISPLNQFYLPIRTLSQKYGRGSTGEDRVLKYIPDGSRKFGTFEVDTRPARPTVVFKLYVDGEEAWSLDVVGQPIHRPTPPASLGRNLAMSLSELLGFGSRRWF